MTLGIKPVNFLFAKMENRLLPIKNKKEKDRKIIHPQNSMRSRIVSWRQMKFLNFEEGASI